jgi:ATP-dependent DNA helicase RecQ
LTGLRLSEQKQMQEYVHLESGHMGYLIRALDGDPGDYQSPAITPLPGDFDQDLAKMAVAFLRRRHLPISPREKWPVGGMPVMGFASRCKIPEPNRCQTGNALCDWGDAGWGDLVREGKYRDRYFDDSLVGACAGMLTEWKPEPRPTWVTCIPSLRHPQLVSNFAERLSKVLKLPFAPVLIQTKERPEQKMMRNSNQQARNVDGSLAVNGDIPSGPVLLIDDMVDSRWTFTVAAYLLTTKGSGPVFPLALASTSQSDTE